MSWSRNSKVDARISVRIFGEERFLGKFAEGYHYIVFGKFRVMGSNSFQVPDSERRIIYKNLAVDIHHAGQFCEVETPEAKAE